MGCGAGYYTAIMAEVVGPQGSVVGLELQPDLAAWAKENLLGYANVAIEAGNGAAFDPGECDAIFVNCGVTHPQTKGLERLGEGGGCRLRLRRAWNLRFGRGGMMRMVGRTGRKGAEGVW